MFRRLYHLLFFLGHAFGIAAPQPTEIGSLRLRKEAKYDIFDPADLSWINKLAAIGDSYSAGIGAGDRLGSPLEILDPQSDYACSRYDHAYPYLINNDPRLGDPKERTFDFKSCSGALAKDVLDEQIPTLDSGQQVVLLSVGGNDVELLNVLNQCIYQWGVVNEEQVAVAKAAAFDKNYAWAAEWDWDTMGRGCEGQLDHTLSLIDSDSFSNDIDKVLNAAKGKLAEKGKIYFTGYGKFFGEELSAECNDVSWSTWIYKAWNLFQPLAKLTQDRRRRMNQLVDAVNKKLKAAADRAGASVMYVDYDSYIGEFGGRYCEPGVDESTTESNTRPRLMFYELNTLDPLGTNPWKRSNINPLKGTFEGKLDIFASITLLVDPEAELTYEKLIEGNTTAGGIFAEFSSKAEAAGIQVADILPDGYGRVFHPQILLHQIIANRVIYDMVNDNEKRNGYPAIPEALSIDSCAYSEPLPTLLPTTTEQPATTIPIETPTGSSCEKTATKELCTVPGEPCGTSLSCESWAPTSTAASMGVVTCFSESRRPEDERFGPVNPKHYEEAVGGACKAFGKKGLKRPPPQDEMWSWTFETQNEDTDTPYCFNIGWEPGCEVPWVKQQEDMGDPIGDDAHNCENIFRDDIFYSCNDAGRGGHIKAGCLIYSFEPCAFDPDHSLQCFSAGRGTSWILNK